MSHCSVMTVLTCWIVVGTSSAFSVHKHENTSDLGADRMETVLHAADRAFPLVTDIYPEIGTDLTQVTWAHGVDSKKKLERTLRDSVMMIEADVSLGKLKSEPLSANRPIMAHPPVTASDLTLEDFLDMVLDESQFKGIKLDIKNSDILERALQITKNRENKIRVPLWLNADIVQGPGGSMSEPLNADMFLSLTKLYFPTAVISVGWKTKIGKDGSYTFDHVRNMRDVLKAAQVTAPVTFPIRAALSTSLESRENMLWLLNQVPGSTVTIWSSFGDEVDVSALLDFIDAIGKEFVGLALPDLALQNIQVSIVLDAQHIVIWTNWEISNQCRFLSNVRLPDVRDFLLAMEH